MSQSKKKDSTLTKIAKGTAAIGKELVKIAPGVLVNGAIAYGIYKALGGKKTRAVKPIAQYKLKPVKPVKKSKDVKRKKQKK